jgi:acetyl-CoA acetyltransferase
MSQPEAYIVAIGRTAGGRRKGALADRHPVDLAATALDRFLARGGIDPTAVEDVIFGCVGQAGEQSTNVARNVALASSLPQIVPGVSIDRQYGSSQQALHFAAHALRRRGGRYGLLTMCEGGGMTNAVIVECLWRSRLAPVPRCRSCPAPALGWRTWR